MPLYSYRKPARHVEIAFNIILINCTEKRLRYIIFYASMHDETMLLRRTALYFIFNLLYHYLSLDENLSPLNNNYALHIEFLRKPKFS